MLQRVALLGLFGLSMGSLLAGCFVPVGEVTSDGDGGTGGGGGAVGGGQTIRIETGTAWKLTASSPPSGWNTSLAFDDSRWPSAPVIVLKGGTAGQLADSIWDRGPTTSSGSAQIWARRIFTLSGTIVAADLNFACNDDMELWLNGTQLIADSDGVTTWRVLQDVKSSLVVGQNLIAASCADRIPPEHALWGFLNVRTQ